jgi:hypothetical protein
MRVLLSLILLSTLLATANNKKKNLLPAYVLKARTVLVVINPDSGISATAPVANRTAQEDVEKAMMRWGRLTPVLNSQTADLVITVRKGNGKLAQPTIGGVPTNDRPVILQPTDNGFRTGGQKGRSPDATGSRDAEPRPRVEVGPSEDMFVVYEGGVDRPLDHPPVWRYVVRDAFHSPDVPAVAEFRKIIEEAEKQQKGRP